MSRLDNNLAFKKISSKYGKVGFPMDTIPSLPFQSNSDHTILTNHQPDIKISDQLYDETVMTKYKSSSGINSPKGQVRFSIPASNNDCNNMNNNDYDSDSTFDTSSGSGRLVNASPNKIVFPRDLSDSESQPIIPSSINENTTINKHNENIKLLARMGIEGHLVDLQSKVMVNVPEEIWNFHHTRSHNKSHQKTKSMDETSLNHNPIISNNISNSNKGHHRSKSLQSIISQTLSEFNSFNDPNDSSFSVGNLTNSKFNDSQISQVSPLNYPSFNNSNPTLKTPIKSTSLYLASDSPINKHNVPIPLEISLPPFLSPKNQHKKRNSLIYDGESYSVYNEEDDNSLSLSSINKEEGDTLSSEILSDSLVSTSSIPSMTYNISFDANTIDPDSLLGIDGEANVNLKRQLRNLKKQKDNTINHKEKSNKIDPKILPPLPSIPQTQRTLKNNDTNHQLKEKTTKSNLLPPSKNTQHIDNVLLNQQSSEKICKYSLPDHSRLSKMIDEYNSPTNTLSPINEHIPNKNNNKSVNTDDYTSESLAILATPSKSIIIPDLDDILLSTPNSTLQSFTSTSNTNSSLKFFDQFEPLYQNKAIVSPINNSRSYGQLDTSFKFPPLLSQQPKTPVKQSYQKNNHNNNSNSNIQHQNQYTDNDYHRTPQDNTQVEKRRQKLLASHLSPNNRIGHSHKRSRSIHSMDFITPQKFLDVENLPPTPSLPFNATSTPPEKEPTAPRRSSLRLRESTGKKDKKAVQNNQLVSNIIISPETIGFNSPNSNNNSVSGHKFQSPIKPLSSFQSFLTPIKNENLIPNIHTDEVSKKQKSYNLLSPRRQLSNPGSNQSSSVNSQFSKISQLTQTTVATEISNNDIIAHNIDSNSSNNKANIFNDSYRVVRERQKDGRIVDVIILDDDSDMHNNNYTIKDKYRHRNTPNNSHENMLTNNHKENSAKLLAKNYKSSPKIKYNSNTRKEQIEHYTDLLEMCENTAMKAKQTIFELAGVSPSSKTNL
ncbi:Fir1p PWA37_004874 [Arxiozyma heterogenica]|uniref:Uncharacterized protein n=1 Tax=Arxiozyma heterogenica TaxID=278026 RepID=A0AAN7W547_9SACH|nr:hypothetical protein RI543_001272 [Kazachstania heterogenica]